MPRPAQRDQMKLSIRPGAAGWLAPTDGSAAAVLLLGPTDGLLRQRHILHPGTRHPEVRLKRTKYHKICLNTVHLHSSRVYFKDTNKDVSNLHRFCTFPNIFFVHNLGH